MRRALVLVMLAVAPYACTRTPAAPPTAQHVEGDVVTIDHASPQLQALSVEEARPRSVPVHHFTGRIAWDDDATVRVYAPVAGRVTRVLVGVGDRVTPGQPLAVISSPDFGQAQADARAAEASLRLARRVLDRQRDLYAHEAAAKKDVDSAESDFAHAQSDYDRARARLALYGDDARTINGLLTLTSPLGGIVAERAVAPGQEVRPDQMLANEPQVLQPLFVVSDPAHLWMWLDVPEVDLEVLQPGALLTMRARAYPDRTFEGQLDVVGAALDPATRTVRARGSVANPDGLLKPEMYVTADLIDGSTPLRGVEVSSKALFLAGGRSYVFVEDGPGRFRRQHVEVGPEQEGRIAVVDGLAPGQRVITEGSLLLKQILDSASVG